MDTVAQHRFKKESIKLAED